jgi:hypothetical protein
MENSPRRRMASAPTEDIPPNIRAIPARARLSFDRGLGRFNYRQYHYWRGLPFSVLLVQLLPHVDLGRLPESFHSYPRCVWHCQLSFYTDMNTSLISMEPHLRKGGSKGSPTKCWGNRQPTGKKDFVGKTSFVQSRETRWVTTSSFGKSLQPFALRRSHTSDSCISSSEALNTS